jgi:phosphoglycolate phosphatase
VIRVVVFDFDGTLFDTREDIADAVNYARRYFGLPSLTLEQVTPMVGYGVSTLTERAFADSEVNLETALASVMEYYAAHPGDKARLYEGVRETLPLIDAVRTIVSNKPEALVRAMLADHDLADVFDFVAGGDTFSTRKPDALAVRFLQARYNVATHEILVVGDHAPDIEMAKQTGCHSVFCRYGFFREDRVGADFQIDRFADLVRVIRSLNR